MDSAALPSRIRALSEISWALIDYDNFKDLIKATPHQQAKLEPYEEFWTLLYNAHFSNRPKRK